METTGGKGSVVLLNSSKHLGCVFQVVEPPKSKSILRGCKKTLDRSGTCNSQKEKTSRQELGKERVHPNVLFGWHSEPHERSPHAPIFEDRSQEETLRQQRCASRGMGKHVHKLKETDKATFYSLAEVLVITRAIVDDTRGKIICCRFRSINAHAKQERSKFSWTGGMEYPETQHRSLQSTEKSHQTRKQQCTSTILI